MDLNDADKHSDEEIVDQTSSSEENLTDGSEELLDRDVRTREESDLCIFCLMRDNDEFKLGKFYTLKDDGLEREIRAHLYCLFFASGLCQNGTMEEGVQGFLGKDILKEVNRARRLRCTYCKKIGASVGCGIKKCKVSYHFPCGKDNQSIFRFYDRYESFCPKHLPVQMYPEEEEPLNTSLIDCPVCLDNVPSQSSFDVLKTPCCHNTYVHRDCIQRQALSSGMYFFRCPICNNQNEFKEEMLSFGIHVPERDAAWERDEGAYQELYQRHSKCDIGNCMCPSGRAYSKKSGKWQIILCDFCGSVGCHVECGRLERPTQDWACTHCRAMLSSAICDVSYNKVRKRKLVDAEAGSGSNLTANQDYVTPRRDVVSIPSTSSGSPSKRQRVHVMEESSDERRADADAVENSEESSYLLDSLERESLSMENVAVTLWTSENQKGANVRSQPSKGEDDDMDDLLHRKEVCSTSQSSKAEMSQSSPPERTLDNTSPSLQNIGGPHWSQFSSFNSSEHENESMNKHSMSSGSRSKAGRDPDIPSSHRQESLTLRPSPNGNKGSTSKNTPENLPVDNLPRSSVTGVIVKEESSGRCQTVVELHDSDKNTDVATDQIGSTGKGPSDEGSESYSNLVETVKGLKKHVDRVESKLDQSLALQARMWHLLTYISGQVLPSDGESDSIDEGSLTSASQIGSSISELKSTMGDDGRLELAAGIGSSTDESMHPDRFVTLPHSSTPLEDTEEDTENFFIGGNKDLLIPMTKYQEFLDSVNSNCSNDSSKGSQLILLLISHFHTEQDMCDSFDKAIRRHPFLEMDGLIPALDDNVFSAIFLQARNEFEDFEEDYRDRFCPTIKKLRKLCHLLKSSSLEDTQEETLQSRSTNSNLKQSKSVRKRKKPPPNSSDDS